LEIHVEQLVRERARWIAALREVPEVLEVLGLSGPTDLLVRVAARDADDLYRIAGQLLVTDSVERTTTSLVMRTLVEHRVAPLVQRLAQERGRVGDEFARLVADRALRDTSCALPDERARWRWSIDAVDHHEAQQRRHVHHAAVRA
jgi:hypothetical protein